jgi:hypothetical protein
METSKNIVLSIFGNRKVELRPSLSGYVYKGEFRRRRKVEDMINDFSKTPLPIHGMLDFLLENPATIPDEWKTDENGEKCHIFFLDTLRVSTSWMTRGQKSVGYMYFYEGSWREARTYLDSDISEGSFVAVFQE